MTEKMTNCRTGLSDRRDVYNNNNNNNFHYTAISQVGNNNSTSYQHILAARGNKKAIKL